MGIFGVFPRVMSTIYGYNQGNVWESLEFGLLRKDSAAVTLFTIKLTPIPTPASLKVELNPKYSHAKAAAIPDDIANNSDRAV